MDNNEKVACEICHQPSRLALVIKGYQHFRCSTCDHLFVWPRPSQVELDRFYADASYYDGAELQVQRIHREATARVKLLSGFCDEFNLKRRLLDVGCASGYFMSVAMENGFTVVGQDRSQEIADRAKSKYGFDVKVGTIEDNLTDTEAFPVVTAWEVVEHARDPEAFFRAFSNIVSPHGILAISTPMGDGLPAKILRQNYPMLTPPEHLSIFSSKSILLLAEKFGFKQIYSSSFSNLDIRGMASGFSRIMFGKKLNDVSSLKQMISLGVGGTCFAVPWVVDKIGYGTEMMVIFRKQ